MTHTLARRWFLRQFATRHRLPLVLRRRLRVAIREWRSHTARGVTYTTKEEAHE